jgi:5'-AMP-activated protein kinase catalytic alpha subunit
MALSDYTVSHIIGRGEYATVKLGEHVGSGRKVAMKWLEKERLDQKVQREISNQRTMFHKHVVKIEDVLDTDDAICIVQEYAPGGDLFDYIVRHVRLKEDEARRIFRQLIAGVGHCHEHMVVHRDLKPENILMDADFNIKIADFGLSSQWSPGEMLTESCGSPNYAAPELLYKGCTYEGPEVDVWSCGVVLYTLLCGALPFDDDSVPGLFKKIKLGRYSIPGWLSAGAKDLIMKMLTVDRAARISLAEVREHFWFKDEDEHATSTSLASATAELEERAFTDPERKTSESVASSLEKPLESVEPVAVIPPKVIDTAVVVGALPSPARCERASKSATQLSSFGDVMGKRIARAGSGLQRNQLCGSQSASLAWIQTALKAVKTM